jgi:hypothetical protein
MNIGTFYRSWRWSVAVMVVLLGIMLWVPGAGLAAAPKAAVGENRFDFGKVNEDQPLSHTFIIKNTGSAPLRIENVDPDCACTVADYDRTIPPGGEGKITLTIKPFSVLRQFRKATRVRINDPEQPLLVFTLHGVAQPFIEIQPSHIVRLRGTPGQDLRGQVRFISHLPTPWQITDYRTNIPDKIEVHLKATQPGKVYVLEVKNKRNVPGPYAGLIELFTTSKQRPRLIVRVFGELYLPSASGQ